MTCKRCTRTLQPLPGGGLVCMYCDFGHGQELPQVGDGKLSFYCGAADIAWPRKGAYRRCPICRELTIKSHRIPIDDDEAADLRKRAAFGWYLLEHGFLAETSEI